MIGSRYRRLPGLVSTKPSEFSSASGIHEKRPTSNWRTCCCQSMCHVLCPTAGAYAGGTGRCFGCCHTIRTGLESMSSARCRSRGLCVCSARVRGSCFPMASESTTSITHLLLLPTTVFKPGRFPQTRLSGFERAKNRFRFYVVTVEKHQ